MPRHIVLICGAGLVGFAFYALSHGFPQPFGIAALVTGVTTMLAALYERSGYKLIEDRLPPGSWQDTGERFIDPTTQRSVAVYSDPKTGRRVYVAMEKPPH